MVTDKTDTLFKDVPGEFLVARDIYRDPDIFDWEMQYIFESTWNLVGLESQIPAPNDYFTAHIGRVPVIVTRDAQGSLSCLINSCTHKGATIAHKSQGNARTFVCQYHGWAFSPSGKNILIRDESVGQYNAQFHKLDHDLRRVPRFESYRGFLFASLNENVPSLVEHLGDQARMLDLIVDQSPDGVECIPGNGNFTYKGNWKFQLENGVDPYHFQGSHPSYIQILQKRSDKGSVYSKFKSSELERGSFSFANGHSAIWGPAPTESTHPLYLAKDDLVKRVGATRAKWMMYVRNITVFPNAQFAENASLQMRIWRPLAPDLTEMRTFCIAPVGESAAARKIRIRQYEEFFNPTGLATPDDIVNYEDCQRGMAAHPIRWQQGAARGETVKNVHPDHPSTREAGVNPLSTVVGPFNLGDETIMHNTYRHWRHLIMQGLARGERAGETKDA